MVAERMGSRTLINSSDALHHTSRISYSIDGTRDVSSFRRSNAEWTLFSRSSIYVAGGDRTGMDLLTTECLECFTVHLAAIALAFIDD